MVTRSTVPPCLREFGPIGLETFEQSAAGNLKEVTLELGGKSPNVVFADADMKGAITGAANGIFFNHGQCGNAGSRLFVQQQAYDDVVAGLVDEAKSINVGPGLDPGTNMGPLISDEQFDKVLGYLQSGREQGAERSPAAGVGASAGTASSRPC